MVNLLSGNVYPIPAPDGRRRPYLIARIPFHAAREVYSPVLHDDPGLVQCLAHRLGQGLKGGELIPQVFVDNCSLPEDSQEGAITEGPNSAARQATLPVPDGKMLTLTSGGFVFKALELLLEQAQADGNDE